MTKENLRLIEELERKALEIRIDIVKMIGCGTGHAGGSLSAVDIVTALYFYQMRYDPKNPDWPKRDRFILSKGHAAPLLYAALAESGYFKKEILWTLRKFKSCLQGHPDMRYNPCIPGIEISTGELGQGLSVGCGIALASRVKNIDYDVYVLLGDGEIQEGQVWEAAMLASHYKIGNLTAIVDNNGLQIDGFVKDVMNIYPILEKWKAFGWNTVEIDGHNMKEIVSALKMVKKINDKPNVIIVNTIKGKGIKDWENKATCHHIHAISEDETTRMINELKEVGK